MSRSKLSNQDLKFYNTSGESDVIYAKIKGSSTDTLIFEGATSATKIKLKNVQDPSASGEVATYDWVNTKVNELSNGLSWKAPVKAKSTANLAGTLTGNVLTCSSDGQQTLDGIAISLNDRVLLASQTDQTQNGIYNCTTTGDVGRGSDEPAVFERAGDADTSTDLKACAVFVEQGTLHADTAYVQTTDSLVLGTSNVVFAQFSSAGEVVAGVGLSKSGNTLSANVDDSTLEIEAGSLVVKDLGITADKIATNTITGSQIQDASILASELADDSVIERTILNSAVTSNKINNSAVTADKILDSACTADKIASNAITTIKILDSNITASKLANDSVETDKILDSAVTASKVASGAITSDKIGDGQVSTNKILDSNITSAKLASNSVVSSKIASNQILTTHVANNQITTDLIASDQINSGHLKSNSVTEGKILNGAVSADKLANNSVTTSKIGTLSGLTVNGIINATSFVATGAGGESDGGFGLPKCKTLSINFTSDQSISGDDTYVTIGTESSLSAVSFAYDDNITTAICFSTYRVKHTGTNNTTISSMYEISYYNEAGVQQSYSDVTTQVQTIAGLSSASTQNYLLGHQAGLGDGSTRIAGIRLRIKHDVVSDTLALTDSLQISAIAIDDTSGNINRTYNAGSIS